MTEQTDLRELRKKIERASQMVEALCKPRGSEGSREWAMSIPARPDYDPDLVIGDGLNAGAAALERLEKLERFLDREGIRRGPIDHGLPTPTIVDRVEAYGYECAIRAIRATPAPATQRTPRIPSVAEVEDAIGCTTGVWDMVDPAEIVEAVLRLSGAPAPQQGGEE